MLASASPRGAIYIALILLKLRTKTADSQHVSGWHARFGFFAVSMLALACSACEVANPAYSPRSSVVTADASEEIRTDGFEKDADGTGDVDVVVVVDAFVPLDVSVPMPDARSVGDAAVVSGLCSLEPSSCRCSAAVCVFACQSDCRASCAGQKTTCEVTAAGISNVQSFECSAGAVCRLNVRNASNARANNCSEGAVCDIDCRDSSNCRTSCTSGASCLLQCEGASNCAFETCAGAVKQCANGIIVCNRPCP